MAARAPTGWSVLLVLGVGAGVLAPSCSEPPKRSCRDTCDGCCAGEQCLPPAHQTFGQCGGNGAACRACLPGEVCSAVGTCQPDPAAPSDGGGLDCGIRGQRCCLIGAGCYAGLFCAEGFCGVAPAPADAGRPDAATPGLPIGAACSQGPECQFGLCAKARLPGGYCSKTCGSTQDCPAGSACALDPGDTTGLSRLCLAECSAPGLAPGGCRQGYVCEKKGASLDGTPVCTGGCAGPADCSGTQRCDGRGFCCGLDGFACCEGTTCAAGSRCAAGYCEANPPPPDAGAPDAGAPDAGGLRPTGAACTAGAQCQGGFCAAEIPAGVTGCATSPCWPGGYCTQVCSGGPCAAGSSCSPYFPPTGVLPRCLRDCAFDAGQGDCRAGYICDRFWIPGSARASCVYRCATDQDCPESTRCNPATGFCCGSRTYSCCAGAACPFGGACGANGYCE